MPLYKWKSLNIQQHLGVQTDATRRRWKIIEIHLRQARKPKNIKQSKVEVKHWGQRFIQARTAVYSSATLIKQSKVEVKTLRTMHCLFKRGQRCIQVQNKSLFKCTQVMCWHRCHSSIRGGGCNRSYTREGKSRCKDRCIGCKLHNETVKTRECVRA